MVLRETKTALSAKTMINRESKLSAISIKMGYNGAENKTPKGPSCFFPVSVRVFIQTDCLLCCRVIQNVCPLCCRVHCTAGRVDKLSNLLLLKNQNLNVFLILEVRLRIFSVIRAKLFLSSIFAG